MKKETQITLYILSGISFSFLIIGLYWLGLSGPFLLDDLQSIEPTQLTHFSFSKLIEITFGNHTGPLGRPISTFTFMLNHYFWGAAPFSFKATNLGLHLLCGVFLAVFIYQLVLLLPLKKSLALPLSFFTTALWLIHPLNVSTVLYSVQRMTQLCHLFILMGLTFYLWGRIKVNTKQSAGFFLIGISLIWFYPLAIFSKETGLLFPWYLLCIEYFLLKFHTPFSRVYLKVLIYSLSFCLLFCAVFYYCYHFPVYSIIFQEKNFSLTDRILTQIEVIPFYCKMIFLPNLSQMGLYHDDFPIAQLDGYWFISFLFLIATFIIIFLTRRRAPIIAFGLTWFFIAHSIESTILPLELVFEHRNYFASIGLFFIFIYYSIHFIKTSSVFIKKMAGIALFLFFFLLGGLTFYRSWIWSNSEQFLVDANISHPHSPRVQIETANWLLNKHKHDLALYSLENAQKLDPKNAGIALHKILIHCHAQSIPPQFYPEAIIALKQGTISPYVLMVLNQIVKNMFENQCLIVDKQKIQFIIQTALENPYLSYKPLYSAVLYHLKAGIVLLEKDIYQSRALLLKSFEIYPKRLDPLIQKAYLEIQNNLTTEAMQTLELIHQKNHLFAPQDKIHALTKDLQISLNFKRGKNDAHN